MAETRTTVINAKKNSKEEPLDKNDWQRMTGNYSKSNKEPKPEEGFGPFSTYIE